MNGIWTAIKYKNEVVDQSLSEADPRKRRPTIYLWTRDTNLKRHRLTIKGFKPYFYAITAIKSDANEIFEMPEIEKYELVEFGKRKLYRIFTYSPGFVPKVKRVIQSRFAQAAVKEADVLYELRYLIDKEIRGEIDFSDSNNPIPINEGLNIPLRRIYIDTEIWANRTVKEGHLRANEFVKCICAYDNYEKIYYTWYFNEYNLDVKGGKDWKIIWCRTVDEMLIKFFEYIRDRDPDIITGYYIDFDLLNIRQEALRRGLNKEYNYLSALSDLGYIIKGPIIKKHRIRGVDWSRKGLFLDGREVIDILDTIRFISTTQLRSYTLDYVSKKYISKDEGKLKYKGKEIAPNIIRIWQEAPEEILKYNKHDVELIVKLDEKNDLIDFLDMLRKTVGVRLEDAFSTQRMIDAEALRRRKYPLPSKFSRRKEEETFKGALVVNPEPGLHKWVVCLDYKSLYPTIIRTFNIDTDTYVLDTKFLKGKEVYKFSNEEGTKAWMFLKRPRGLFPEMLDDFTALRNSIRRQMEKETDIEKKKLKERKQEVIKVLSNAVYGCFSKGTKVLTLSGPKNIEDLEVGEEVYTLNPKTGNVEPQKIIQTHVYPFSGELVKITHDKVSFEITPNHKMWGEPFNEKKDFYEASEISKKYTFRFEKLRPLTEKDLDIPEEELKLIAWYISEGSIYHNKQREYPNGDVRGISNKVYIAQTSPFRDEIISLMKRNNLNPIIEKKGISFSSKEWCNFLETQCGKESYSKHIPPSFYRLSPKQTTIFLEELWKGDGRKNKRDYRTVSERLAQDIAFLIQKTGHASSITPRDESNCFTVHRSLKRNNAVLKRKAHFSKIFYQGNVFCITVPNHIILAGRDGKYQWIGQSFAYRSRKHSLEVAEAVTAFGQKLIKLACQIAQEMGFKVIYGNTDSLFVQVGTSYGEAYNNGKRLQDAIMKKIPQFTYQFGVYEKNLFSIELEKIYSSFFMAAGKKGVAIKKRYYGKVITKEGKTYLDVKGFDIKRSDTSEFATELQQHLLSILLEGKSKSELANYLANELNNIEKLSLEKIGVPSAISKPFRSYKANAIQKKAAINSNKYLGTQFDYGSKPLRVYIKVPKREKIFPRSTPRTEEEKKELERELRNLDVLAFDSTIKFPDWAEIDYARMLRLTVKPKIETLLQSLDISWEEIEKLLRPEFQKKKTKKEKKSTTTLDTFMGEIK